MVRAHNRPEDCLMIIWNFQPDGAMDAGGVYDLTRCVLCLENEANLVPRIIMIHYASMMIIIRASLRR